MSQENWDRLERLYKQAIINGMSITNIWSDEDVEYQAEQDEVTLTRDEVRDVLSLMDNDHDACIGINWDVISYHIDCVVQEREK